MLRILPVTAGSAVAVVLFAPGPAGAQSAPTPSSLEANWSEGSRLVRAGVAALVSAEKSLGDAARRGVEASARRNTSGANPQRAAGESRGLASPSPTSTEAVEAQRWAALLQAAATKWQGFQTQEREATRDLNLAIQQNSTAQKAVEAALVQVDRGRQMIGEPQPVSGTATGGPPELMPQAPAPVQ